MEIVNCACILLDMNLEYRSNVRYAVLVKVAAVQRKKKHCSSMLITATHIGTTTIHRPTACRVAYGAHHAPRYTALCWKRCCTAQYKGRSTSGVSHIVCALLLLQVLTVSSLHYSQPLYSAAVQHNVRTRTAAECNVAAS